MFLSAFVKVTLSQHIRYDPFDWNLASDIRSGQDIVLFSVRVLESSILQPNPRTGLPNIQSYKLILRAMLATSSPQHHHLPSRYPNTLTNTHAVPESTTTRHIQKRNPET
jgi:hypothetical protein